MTATSQLFAAAFALLITTVSFQQTVMVPAVAISSIEMPALA